MPAIFTTICERMQWDHDGESAVVPLPAGREQRVHCAVAIEGDDEVMRIHTVLGSVQALNETRMRAALAMNFRLRHGAFAIDGGRLVMVDTFLLRDADEDEVRLSIEYIAAQADSYEKAIYGTDQY
ncbi:MAG TPA: YbjN domain-containing protein [Planctomycetota bacterium]|nr:YbjN domain-containing protein [Planctomycetota bacterium]